jgi:prepilin-type N-terminal cleavage/methylation domain-containing protein
VKVKTIQGFTLMELLIVMAIISVVGVIASYNWNHYVRNTELRTFARELTSDIAKLKQTAIKEELCYQITIHTASNGNNYTIERGNSANCAAAAFTVLETKSPASLGLRGGLDINSTTYGSDDIEFQTRGTISPGSVVMQSSTGSNATITSNVTGKTYVQYNMR